MTTTPLVSAILRQLDAALQLIETASPFLSASDLADIRCALQHTYSEMGVSLQNRNLLASGTLTREFGRCFLDP